MNSQWNREMNEKLYNRNVPSHCLPPNLSVYPIQTKYVKLGTADYQPTPRIPPKQYVNYQSNKMFCPTSKNGNFQGYANNIHVESELRNQFYALQKSDACEYIPNKHSELFGYNVKSNQNLITQPYQFLFDTSLYFPNNYQSQNKFQSLFCNHTRQQLKDT